MERHSLDAIGAAWLWLWPLPADPRPDFDAWRRAGITGVVPQSGVTAVRWAERWGVFVRGAGFDLVVGLGRISADAVVAALRVPLAAGCMIDQEAWKSVPDSRALVSAVLSRVPDAAARTVDCHYPALIKNPETGRPTGHARIAVQWAPLCGLRAPQCYWSAGAGGRRDGAPDGWVAARLEHARREYPIAGGSPRDRVRASVQLYARSVADHVAFLLQELATGSVWLWDWREADASARVGLEVVAALAARAFRGVTAVRDFQASTGGLVADGIVGPRTAAALGVTVPAGVVWGRR